MLCHPIKQQPKIAHFYILIQYISIFQFCETVKGFCKKMQHFYCKKGNSKIRIPFPFFFYLIGTLKQLIQSDRPKLGANQLADIEIHLLHLAAI